MPFSWPALFARPAEADFAGWFDVIAHRLLNGCRVVANGVPVRLIEVEAYYHGPGHEDPFAHCDPVQLTAGRWYFHRTGGAYRGGSFKGLDLTFGDGRAFGGMLFRGVQSPDGSVIDGPSLTVDHLLKLTGHPSVKSLDVAMGEQPAWQPGPLQLVASPELEQRPVLKCLRVGLTLKRRTFKDRDPAFAFLFRNYRYLSDPKRTAKGKTHMVLPLIADGRMPDEITTLTGCPTATVKRYDADFATGRTLPSAEPFYGREMSTADLCQLYGAWWARHGDGMA